MFRIGLKFPCNGLNRVKKHGYSRLYLLNARYHETRTPIKCEPDGRLLKDVKLTSRFSGPKYSTEAPKREKTRGSGGLITLGALTIGTFGILAYAKQDPEFRETLEKWIPGSNKVIQIIFQEERSLFDSLRDLYERITQSSSQPDWNPSEVGKNPVISASPKSAFETLSDVKEPPKNEQFYQIRFVGDPKDEVELASKEVSSPAKDHQDTLLPENLVELEASCGQAAARAIEAYHTATCAIEKYNKDVVKVVENTENTDVQFWDRLKDATEARKKALAEAENSAGEALRSLRTLSSLIDDPKLAASPVSKTVARRNIKKIIDDVDEAKQKFDKEAQSANVTERYWKQVLRARKNFEDELEILFPKVNIAEKKFSVDEDSFDLFVLHMYHKVNALTKELQRLQTVNAAKLEHALKLVGDEAERAKIEAQICNEVNKERQILQDDFAKKLLAETKKYNDELRTQLKLQAQIHADHLRDALSQKDRETQRVINRTLSEQVEAEASKYKIQLAAVVGRLQGLDAALKARLEEEKSSSNAQMLWGACQALARAVKVAPPGVKAEDAVRPLEAEIKAVSKAANGSDPLVNAVINGIPEIASKRGVFPEDALRERFLKVENMARRLALVPENGASLPIYLLSYLQSFLLVKAVSPIPKAELDDQPIDPSALSTYDVLQRARYWLDRGDFKMTLRYMNLLKGAPRSVANDWINEATILLETQQAVDTLIAHAGAAGLVFFGGGDSAKNQSAAGKK
ncbi:MICOS complex subunit Mic60 isoform X1 [Neodiprion fabricii]|uniref:MICOS complex subunit Mic60 isoform X1 n=1 Tax=Neodiprion fabricii TaxID=2872261 RepID=UPI001ED921D1|nr:MICOS complex subunit Mic60 isoform X1 [Neodiprion fabricii]